MLKGRSRQQVACTRMRSTPRPISGMWVMFEPFYISLVLTVQLV